MAQVPTQAMTEARPLPRDVFKAICHFHGCMAGRVITRDLAAHCAVPERTLYRHFRCFVGLTPVEYLRRLRLASVRAELVRPEGRDTIAHVAAAAGFRHIGRFSAEYLRCFGEHPSDTVRRHRPEAR